MYFSIEPKEKKEDIFNFEREYEELKKAIRGPHKLIVIKGVRRIGKTSLMKSIYKETKNKKIFIDTREIIEMTPGGVNDFFTSILLNFLKRERFFEGILSYIESIEFGVKISLKRKKPMSSKLLEKINEKMQKQGGYLILFIDEAQELKKARFERMLAFIYDNLKNIKVVLAGSEVGILDKLIGTESDSPLYGRAKKIIEIKKLSYEGSLDFLKSGFHQAKKKVGDDVLKEVVDKLDGVIGWLSLYGFYALEEGHEKALHTTFKEGAKIVASELNRFLSNREVARIRYKTILSALSQQPRTWSEIKSAVSIKERKAISDTRISELLSNLQDYGFIEKINNTYKIVDPLLIEALKLLR